jgi:hypothetical protein
MAIQATLFCLNAYYGAINVLSAVREGTDAYNAFQSGYFWDGAMDTLECAFSSVGAFASIVGMSRTMMLPPGIQLTQALSASGGEAALSAGWKIVVDVPVVRDYFAETLAPTLLYSGICVLSAMTARGPNSLNTEVIDGGTGAVKSRGDYNSSGTRLGGGRLTWQEQLGTHEKQWGRDNEANLNPGDEAYMVGTWDPCKFCNAYLRRLANTKKIVIYYLSRDSGTTFKYEPKG